MISMIGGLLLLVAMPSAAQRSSLQPGCACSEAALTANAAGLEAHLRRSLTAASDAYARALKAEPARDPTPSERSLMMRFAPRVMVTPNEPFALKDAAAILHPRSPWIAYHLFWEDDIDFPDDNDPCDHELLWVKLNPERTAVMEYYTYFHGRILRASAGAVKNANDNGGRVEVVSQWGKHGTMPPHWQSHPINWDAGDSERRFMPPSSAITLEAYNRATWRKLSTEGRQSVDSPLGKAWPKRFEGSWDDFINFSKPVEIRAWLERQGYLAVSCLNNAAINRRFLRYNFAAKTEWPAALCEAGSE